MRNADVHRTAIGAASPAVSVSIPRAPGAGAGLDEWLAWQAGLNPVTIELGLGRCAAVAGRMGLLPPPFPLINIAGTNGKGSCAIFTEALLSEAGRSVGTYLSPHLLRYNERVRVCGREVDDAQLVAAFHAVEAARGSTPLTFFEFGTLAAVSLFCAAAVDVAILEVGLGGRLDAVNVFAPAVALITSLGVDHVEWLGATRAQIAREKAGIMRRGCPAVCAEPDPPAAFEASARECGALLYRIGMEFDFQVRDDGLWDWRGVATQRRGLPPPALQGAFQFRNAAAALAVIERLDGIELPPGDAIARALGVVRLAGRMTVVEGPVTQVIDVGHNPEAARALAAWLRENPGEGRDYAVAAMLADKDCDGVTDALRESFDRWYVAGLGGPRGNNGAALADSVGRATPAVGVRRYPAVGAAYRAALDSARPGDRVVVFGSFRTAGECLLQVERSGRKLTG